MIIQYLKNEYTTENLSNENIQIIQNLSEKYAIEFQEKISISIKKKDYYNKQSVFYNDFIETLDLIELEVIDYLLHKSISQRLKIIEEKSENTQALIFKNLKIDASNPYNTELRRRLNNTLKLNIRKIFDESLYNYSQWNDINNQILNEKKASIYKKLLSLLKSQLEKISYQRENKEQRETSLVHSLTINQNADNVFYYLKIIYKDKAYYKVGITRNSVEARYPSYNNYIILYEERVDGAIRFEEMLKNKFKEDLFHLALLGTKGTEIFDKDILKLDS